MARVTFVDGIDTVRGALDSVNEGQMKRARLVCKWHYWGEKWIDEYGLNKIVYKLHIFTAFSRQSEFSALKICVCHFFFVPLRRRRRKQSLQSFVEQIRQAGGEVLFDIIPGLNHPQTCEQSFTAERIGWVMGHSKQ